MVPSIKIKTLFRGFSMSAMRLFLRYVAGMAVGIIPLTSSRLLVELFIGIDTVIYLEIMLGIFVLALPSILVWHILNEAIWLTNFEIKYREHVTAFGVASIVMMWVAFSGRGLTSSTLNCPY